MYPEILTEHLSLVGLDVKSLGQKDEAAKILSLREEDREAGWYGVVDLWEIKDAQGSVRLQGGHLNWAWKIHGVAKSRT